jgi:phospholipase/lecithinase/hemolysin
MLGERAQYSRCSKASAAIALLTAALAACSSGGGDTSQPSATPPPSPAAPAAEVQPQTPPSPPASPPLPPPSAVFVLGDSLSDIGNAAAARDYLLNVTIDPPTVGLCNPTDVLVTMRRCDDLFFAKNRVSDGPVAVEHLAASFGLAPLRPSLHVLPSRARGGTVYAVSGGKARGSGEDDLARQIDWLLVDHAPLPADAVYVVMIGSNDAMEALRADAATPAGQVRPSTAIVRSTVDSIGTQVERLLDFGARRLIVANVPNLAMLPTVRTRAQATADEAQNLAMAGELADSFNRSLAARLDRIVGRASSLTPTPVIARFDLHAALSAARQALAAAGGNTDDACFDSELYRDTSTAQRRFHADCAPPTVDAAPRFERFVFFDRIHPSGAAHAALGKALATAASPPPFVSRAP